MILASVGCGKKPNLVNQVELSEQVVLDALTFAEGFQRDGKPGDFQGMFDLIQACHLLGKTTDAKELVARNRFAIDLDSSYEEAIFFVRQKFPPPSHQPSQPSRGWIIEAHTQPYFVRDTNIRKRNSRDFSGHFESSIRRPARR